MRAFVQRDVLLMSLGFLHRTLSASANEEVEYSLERLLWIIVRKIVTACSQFAHNVLQFGCLWRIVEELLVLSSLPFRKTSRIANVQLPISAKRLATFNSAKAPVGDVWRQPLRASMG